METLPKQPIQAAASVESMAKLEHEVERFLFHEAYLLDRGRFDEWLGLFTEDATYWVPLEQDQPDPFNTSSLIYDDRRLLEVRVRQTRHPRAHARNPGSRTCHHVSNVLVQRIDETGTHTEVVVSSALIVVEFRAERQRVFGGACEHRLRRTAEGLRIAGKRIDLVNSEGELNGISFLF